MVIGRPVNEVFGFVENPSNDRLWRGGTIEAEITSEGPIGAGTTGREVFRFLRQRGETTWEITEYVPNQRVSYINTSGPVTYKGTFTYEAVPEGTRLTFTHEWEPVRRGPFGRMTHRLLQLTSSGTNESELANLKRPLEA